MYKKFNEKWHAQIAWIFFFCCFRSFTKGCLNFIVRFRHLLGYSGWNELELKNKFADLTSPQETHFSFLVLSRALGRKICTDFTWNRNMCNSLWRPFPILFFLYPYAFIIVDVFVQIMRPICYVRISVCCSFKLAVHLSYVNW